MRRDDDGEAHPPPAGGDRARPRRNDHHRGRTRLPGARAAGHDRLHAPLHVRLAVITDSTEPVVPQSAGKPPFLRRVHSSHPPLVHWPALGTLACNALPGNALPGTVTRVVVCHSLGIAYWCPPMTMGANEVWLFRIVHQDTGKPAQGVPVTVLDRAGNAEGHWVSDADGTVAIPRRDTVKLRLRVGLRSEEPIELATATLGEGPTPLAAPTQLPPTIGSIGHSGERAVRDAPAAQPPPPRAAEQPEVPGHVLYFQRLVMFAERAAGARSPMPGGASPSPRDGAIDFFSPPTDGPPTMRYGVLVEVEESWQSLGVLWGELLYSVTLPPGDEAKLAVLDGRWRREADGRERPLQIRARTERMSHALRRRPLGVVDAPADTPATGAIRHVRNTTRDRLVTFHFFEPLERFKVMVRSPRARPVVFVPFRLPNVATADVIQRFGYLFRRTLLDRGLLPDLERLLAGEEPGAAPSGAPRTRLLEHIEANLLYYSTAIISAGDPAARHVALSKLRDPAGRPLTDVVENTVIGRVGSAIALPLRAAEELPVQWRDTLAHYQARPLRVSDGFVVTIPHPGVWVSAQAHEPMQQQQTDSHEAAG